MLTEFGEDFAMNLLICSKDLLLHIINQFLWIFGIVLTYGFLVRYVGKERPIVFHILSIVFGVGMLHVCIERREALEMYVFFITSSYFCIYGLLLIDDEERRAIPVCYITATAFYMFFCEHFIASEKNWLQVRGIIMIAALKGVSVAMDVGQHHFNLQNPFDFFGYMLCPANVIFGPVISYGQYAQLIYFHKKLDWTFLFALFRLFGSMGSTLIVSSCLDIPDMPYAPILHAYFLALGFRMSHYFVCYMSEFTMVAAGYNDHGDDEWGYNIVKPFTIECPQSLRSVVNNWNIPMYKFLKKVYYVPNLRKGKLFAIFATFLVSSMFHGLNIQVTVILMHLALFSYIQLRFRTKLARRFSACVKVRNCTRCRHQNTFENFFVFFTNMTLGLLALVDLTYLGVLMTEVGISRNHHKAVFNTIYLKWFKLGFFSHIVNLIFLIISFFL